MPSVIYHKVTRSGALILELYGPEAAVHARMAPGLATLPLGVPVTIAAEVANKELALELPRTQAWVIRYPLRLTVAVSQIPSASKSAAAS